MINKLNKKLEKIKIHVYELIKSVIAANLEKNFEDQDVFTSCLNSNKEEVRELRPVFNKRIQEYEILLKKYFEGIEELDESEEKKIKEDSNLAFTEMTYENAESHEKWTIINVCKK